MVPLSLLSYKRGVLDFFDTRLLASENQYNEQRHLTSVPLQLISYIFLLFIIIETSQPLTVAYTQAQDVCTSKTHHSLHSKRKGCDQIFRTSSTTPERIPSSLVTLMRQLYRCTTNTSLETAL